MANLGTLTLDLVAKTGGFTKPMDKAERKSDKTAKQIARHQAKMRAQMKKTIKQAAMFGAAMGVAAVAAATHFVKASIDAADKAAKTARAVGVTTEAFQALTFAASLGGVEQDKLANGLKKLSMTLGDAASGLKAQEAYFNALGISIRNVEGDMKSADEVLLETADIFADMPDGVDKTTLAMKLFGKSGADMIPLLNGGKEGIEALMKQAEDLGIVMSDKSAKQAEAFNDSLTVLKATSGGLWNQLTANLLPALNGITGELIGVTEEGDAASGVADGLATAFRGIVSVAVGAATAFNLAGQAIGGFASAALFAIQGDWKAAKLAWESMGDTLESTAWKYTDFMDGLWKSPEDNGEVNQKIKERADLLKKLRSAMGYDDKGVAAGGAAGSKSGKGKSFIAGFLAPIDEDLNEFEKERRKRIGDSISGLKEEYVALSKTEIEQKKYEALKTAGVAADSKAGAQIISLVDAIEKRKEATKAATEAMKEQHEVIEESVDLMETVKEAENKQREKYQKLNDALANTFVAGFKGQVDSIGDIWKNLMDNMYTEFVTNIAKMAAEKLLYGDSGTGGLIGLGMSIFGGGGGGAGTDASLATMFAANGGFFNGELRQVSGALAGGGVGNKKSNWQLFEKGPEAVIPLSNPKAIKPIVNALGGGGGTVINNYQTVYANDAKSFREQMAEHTDMMQAESARVVRRAAPGAVANNIARRGVMNKVLGG